MGRLLIAIAILLCLAWAGAVAYEAWVSWPHLSLDLSHGDARTQAAYDQAVIMHVVRYAVVGIAPFLIVTALSLMFGRSRKS